MKSVSLVILIAIILSCKVTNFPSNRLVRLKDCQTQWEYEDLSDPIEIRVLTAQNKYKYDMASFPNFVIGVTPAHDTIGVVDNLYSIDLQGKQTLKVLPHQYESLEKQLSMRPATILDKVNKQNRYNCSVTKVYYGRITDKM